MSVSVRTVTELYMLRFSFNVSRISNSFDRLSSFQTKGKKVLQHYEENAFDVFLIDQQNLLWRYSWNVQMFTVSLNRDQMRYLLANI